MLDKNIVNQINSLEFNKKLNLIEVNIIMIQTEIKNIETDIFMMNNHEIINTLENQIKILKVINQWGISCAKKVGEINDIESEAIKTKNTDMVYRCEQLKYVLIQMIEKLEALKND